MNLKPSVLIFVFALTGCGGIANVVSYSTKYENSDDGETANLRVISNGMVRAVPRSACRDWRLPQSGVMVSAQAGFADRNGESLNMPNPGIGERYYGSRDDVVRTELRIPAEQPFTFTLLGFGDGAVHFRKLCKTGGVFVPKAGKNYELIQLATYQCLTVLREISDAENPIPVPFEPAPFCRIGDSIFG